MNSASVYSTYQMYASRPSLLLLPDLRFDTCQLAPNGMVVFVPSYAFLNTVKEAWKMKNFVEKLAKKKQVLIGSIYFYLDIADTSCVRCSTSLSTRRRSNPSFESTVRLALAR